MPIEEVIIRKKRRKKSKVVIITVHEGRKYVKMEKYHYDKLMKFLIDLGCYIMVNNVKWFQEVE